MPRVDRGDPGWVEELALASSGQCREGYGGKRCAEGRVPDCAEIRLPQHRRNGTDGVDRARLALIATRRDRGVALDVLDRAHARVHRPLHVGHGLVALKVDEVRGQRRVIIIRRGDQPQWASRRVGHRLGRGNVERTGETGALRGRMPGLGALFESCLERVVAVDCADRELIAHGPARDEGSDVFPPLDRPLALSVQVDHG